MSVKEMRNGKVIVWLLAMFKVDPIVKTTFGEI